MYSFHQATEIQAGMDIFSIPQPPYKELAFLEHELELLSRMWGAVADWEATYGGWKNGHFKELKVCSTRGVFFGMGLETSHVVGFAAAHVLQQSTDNLHGTNGHEGKKHLQTSAWSATSPIESHFALAV